MNILGITNSISRNGSGVSSAMMELYLNINSEQNRVTVFSNRDEYSEIDSMNWNGISIHALQTDKFATSLNINHKLHSALENFILSNITKENIIHLHGLWQYTSFITNEVSCKHSIPYVISPHGMLDQYILQRNSYKKIIARFLFENKNLKNANVLHALTEKEKFDFTQLGLKNKIAIIPNGVCLPNAIPRDMPWPYTFTQGRKVLLYVSRVHPKKGLANLMLSLNEISSKSNFFENWCVIIGGWDQLNHTSELKELLTPTLNTSVYFSGGLVGDVKDAAFKNADAFILPSFSEGLPVSILEAWSYKLPVLMTSFCNLNYAFEVGAAIEIETTVKSISQKLYDLNCTNYEELKLVGEKGHDIVKQRYTWDIISNQFISLYKYIVDNSPNNKPDFIF